MLWVLLLILLAVLIVALIGGSRIAVASARARVRRARVACVSRSPPAVPRGGFSRTPLHSLRNHDLPALVPASEQQENERAVRDSASRRRADCFALSGRPDVPHRRVARKPGRSLDAFPPPPCARTRNLQANCLRSDHVRAMKRWNDLGPRTRRLLVVAGAIDAVLKIAALIDLTRRPSDEVRGSKAGWAAAVSLVNSLGVVPLAYFAWGRRKSAT